MIYVLCPNLHAEVTEIISSALARSFTKTMVTVVSFDDLDLDTSLVNQLNPNFLVVVGVPDLWSAQLIELYKTCAIKILLLGAIPTQLASFLGVESEPVTKSLSSSQLCESAQAYHDAESSYRVVYKTALDGYRSPVQVRPFIRYDFADEWNNLGFGAIKMDGSIWSLNAFVKVPDYAEVASVFNAEEYIGAYVTHWSHNHANILWFNRQVGPVDSQEWVLVEYFFCQFKHASTPCVPYLSEIPFGFDSAVTMRLDCDEDVESARALWEAYIEMEVPFSLAIHTKILNDAIHYVLPKEVLLNGGALLSHSATHARDWGGSYDAALDESATSRQHIYDCIGYMVDYAVSPFHQTPNYARTALAEVGYRGCIGGIIRNDSDFLMARSGVPPYSAEEFIGYSQQCMFHGDCMLEEGDALRNFKRAYDYANRSGTFFGFLDHPFSSRYQYGWEDEAQRIAAHQSFITYIKSFGNVLFSNLNDAMDFLRARSKVSIINKEDGYEILVARDNAKWPIAVCYKGEKFQLTDQGTEL